MSTVRYEVVGLDLVPQRLNMACWYASTRMLLNWKENQRTQSSAMVAPELDVASRALRDANNGVQNPQIIQVAKRLGLKAVPPMSVTPAVIGQWLRHHGPLWVNGRRHIVAIGGIDGEKVKVYDPWPVNVGKTDWRSLSTWYEGSGSSGRDIGSGVQTVFLHC